ncbi:MAG: DUF1761 domain-containing protein [Candidatus Gracilibacteria bacterium]
MVDVSVNYLAVVVCGVIYMAIGSLWYSPLLFGNYWAKMNGFDLNDKKKMAAMKNKAMAAMLVSFVTTMVTAYVLKHFITYAGAKDAATGAIGGFWAWLGFIGTTLLANSMYQQKPLKLWLVDASFYLVNLLIFGALLVAWV